MLFYGRSIPGVGNSKTSKKVGVVGIGSQSYLGEDVGEIMEGKIR